MSHASKIFQSLEGQWSLARTFSNGSIMKGTASFMKSAHCQFSYREDGLLTDTSKQTLPMFRNYMYALQAETIRVFFPETPPRLMHKLDFSKIPAKGFPTEALAIHHCHPDIYIGHYTFISPKRFTLSYEVQGPEKDYTIFTAFTKTQ